MKVIERNISELIPAEYNPRYISDEALEHLKASIQRFDAVEPVLVNVHPDRRNIIISGHQRIKAAKSLGLETFPCVELELDKDRERELNIRMNKNTGAWDWDELSTYFDVYELTEWGFDEEELFGEFDDEELEAEEDDYEVQEEIETDFVLGDLIEIGEHRLLCGDSTDSDAVAKLMNGEKADVGFNDPPYGMKKESEGVIGDNMNYDDLLQFNRDWISLQFAHLKDNGSFYCWGTDEPLMDIYSNILKPYIKTKKATFRNLITWDKGRGQGQNAEEFRMYPIADEKCLFVMCGVQRFNNNADNYWEGFDPIRIYLKKQRELLGWTNKEVADFFGFHPRMADHWFSESQWSFPREEQYERLQKEAKGDAFKKEYDELKKEYDELKKEYYSTRAYFNNTHDNQNNVWNFERTSNREREGTGGHATPKPIRLCERAIKSSCPENGISIDFFLGSGSTMVACHQLKRKCYGMELDPKYCQVIVDRMLKLDPSLEVKVNGDKYVV